MSAWVEHVRKYAKDHNISYMCAISKASASYRKQKAKPKQKTLDPKLFRKFVHHEKKKKQKTLDPFLFRKFIASQQ